jgi:hypothetical protein
LGTRAAPTGCYTALPKCAASRPALQRASDLAGERELALRERAGEGDSPCGRLSNSPLPPGRTEAPHEREQLGLGGLAT